MRIIFYCEPEDPNLNPIDIKCKPDYESMGAVWASHDEIRNGGLLFRGDEPRKWSDYLARGGHVFPLSMLEELKTIMG